MEKETTTIIKILGLIILVITLLAMFYQIYKQITDADEKIETRISRLKVITILCGVTAFLHLLDADWILSTVWIFNGVVWYHSWDKEIKTHNKLVAEFQEYKKVVENDKEQPSITEQLDIMLADAKDKADNTPN